MLGLLRTLAVGVATCVVLGWITWELASSSPSPHHQHHHSVSAGQMILTAGVAAIGAVLAMVIDRVLQRRNRWRTADPPASV
jgi:hypothetical protein